jgi:hypothetical protein
MKALLDTKAPVAVVIAALLSAVPALAQNNNKGGGGTTAAAGLITIDQARADAGGVTPGDAPGFPVTLSQPGSYRLMGNLTVSDANVHAIHITADNVTLDLNGFQISGAVTCGGTSVATLSCTPATSNGHGVAADQRRFVEVHGGAISGFRAGVLIGDHGRVSAMRIGQMSLYGIYAGKNVLIDDNRIGLVKGRGIVHDGIARGNQVHLATMGIDIGTYGLNLNNYINTAQFGISGWVGGAASVGGNLILNTSLPLQNHVQISPNQCGAGLCANFY